MVWGEQTSWGQLLGSIAEVKCWGQLLGSIAGVNCWGLVLSLCCNSLVGHSTRTEIRVTRRRQQGPDMYIAMNDTTHDTLKCTMIEQQIRRSFALLLIPCSIYTMLHIFAF